MRSRVLNPTCCSPSRTWLCICDAFKIQRNNRPARCGSDALDGAPGPVKGEPGGLAREPKGEIPDHQEVDLAVEELPSLFRARPFLERRAREEIPGLEPCLLQPREDMALYLRGMQGPACPGLEDRHPHAIVARHGDPIGEDHLPRIPVLPQGPPPLQARPSQPTTAPSQSRSRSPPGLYDSRRPGRPTARLPPPSRSAPRPERHTLPGCDVP